MKEGLEGRIDKRGRRWKAKSKHPIQTPHLRRMNLFIVFILSGRSSNSLPKMAVSGCYGCGGCSRCHSSGVGSRCGCDGASPCHNHAAIGTALLRGTSDGRPGRRRPFCLDEQGGRGSDVP